MLGRFEQEPIEQATRGIIFLSTPHLGSPIAKPAHEILRLTQGFGIGANTELLDSLKEGSEELRLAHEWFSRWLRGRNEHHSTRVHIASFCEAIPVFGNTMVGPSNSSEYCRFVPRIELLDLSHENRWSTQIPQWWLGMNASF